MTTPPPTGPGPAAPAFEALMAQVMATGRTAEVPTTVSRAWVELVGYHAAENHEEDFAAFAGRTPALFDKRLLTRFYRSATLAGAEARGTWVAPDLTPFPWNDPAGPTASSPAGVPLS
ncbi:hypothetical protein [Jidongwangia harbinensis]|uniref:hypothetical protein n=1 Tax=Jidongwangia harbinensis TaxID=2878561 RepID=UPI001CD988AF|nr:hypothetical protein [Jidongwangia harbinensis]MCA2219221.1 hypothetical protein [Jidongwangia harbinensis]